ncbi:hypothetical protein PCANC_19636 [Puccinia coronata f. sp. avenae]|uniref:Uncharacterized protein n=1 Tax=Puccinia coronata f. sp. avenae TaxID=200324 RepID=A0A2N5UHZ7_9BASI|nr:hypothetical protein PCASD_16534 [Puccinia coronata f. sp. avenae]PLW37363.1 hypothetical protein PCANC_19636 [Puccinia coronata f. sp. avenae]
MHLLGKQVSKCYLLAKPVSDCYLLFERVADCYLLGEQVADCYLLGKQVADCYLLGEQVADCYLLGEQVADCYLLGEQVADCYAVAAGGSPVQSPGNRTGASHSRSNVVPALAGSSPKQEPATAGAMWFLLWLAPVRFPGDRTGACFGQPQKELCCSSCPWLGIGLEPATEAARWQLLRLAADPAEQWPLAGAKRRRKRPLLLLGAAAAQQPLTLLAAVQSDSRGIGLEPALAVACSSPIPRESDLAAASSLQPGRRAGFSLLGKQVAACLESRLQPAR